MGMISTLPVAFIKWEALSLSMNRYQYTFFVGALLEEAAKYGITYWFAVRNREFNEEYDGILYAVSASLGFATVENILKVMHFGLGAAEIRALLSVPGHALFGVIMGSYFGLAKFQPKVYKRRIQFSQALILPWILHGIYDVILLKGSYLWMLLLIPFMLWLLWSALGKVKQAQTHSPFKSI
ncbi:MAG: hypothetical protein JWN30_2 [Bacilli bacterium]|nr:hypothetical protein [Bacilli bacterium]